MNRCLKIIPTLHCGCYRLRAELQLCWF